MNQFTNSQRDYLRRLAHDLRPVVQIGKNGLTEGVIGMVNSALDSHELIKIKFIDFQDERRELTDEIVSRTGSTLVTLIGNVAVLYRENPNLPERKVRLPAA